MKLNIEEAVNRFKQKNGGTIEYSTKELIAAIWEKLDWCEKRVTYNRANNYILIMLVVGIYLKIFAF